MSLHSLKMLLFSLCALLAFPSVNAGVLSVDDAQGIAADFFHAGKVSRLADPSALQLVHTAKNSAGVPVFYVFNAVDGRGFIIVAADDKVSPVIGYSYDAGYDAADVPPTTASMLSAVATEISAAPAGASRRIMARAEAGARKELNTAPWSQEAPFNNLIPGRRLVGCVGTALATIMKHHNHPAQGRGSVGNVDFNVAYDWENMRTDNYRNGYSDVEATAVATVVSHAAQAILTDFGMSSSSAFEVRVPAALINNFGYDAGVSYKKRAEMGKEDWERVLVAEIDADRPVLYSGQDVSAGHAFVCDGYEQRGSSTYFHINWGWGGLANGYFASDALNPQASHNYNFNDQTTIVYNIKPATGVTEWSPIHITSDERQIGMTTGVTDLVPGMEFTVRAGNFKNITFEDFSGRVAVALFGADDVMKTLISADQGLSLPSLQILSRGYADFKCTVPADASVVEGDVVRLVTRVGDGQWLPVAGDLLTIAQVPAKGNVIPYFTVNIPSAVDGADVSVADNKVIKGREFSFSVSPKSADKVVTVKANGFIITPGTDNVDRLNNVLADQNIQIIVQNAADVVSKRALWVSAGTLSTLISDTDAGTITDLTLFGTIDVNDFNFMRERMKLASLDLSGVTIVANGSNPANAIPAKAFRNYWSLKRIVLPKNLTTLKSGCFNVTGLRSIEIPASVSTYEYNIFLNCSDLAEVIVRRSSPAWVNWCVFTGTPKARLVVPVGSRNAYASKENWKEFREIVEENPAPVTKCNVTLQEIQGVKITALTEGTEFEPGASYKFTVETDDTFGDATMEVYANNTRLTADASGVYTVSVKENTFIYTRFKQPTPSYSGSPWKITASQGGVGMCTDVVNVVPGKNFSIRVNALSIPADNAMMYYAAVLTDAKGAIKEFISPIITNGGSNYGDLPCSFTCQVKEATVREGNLIRVATSSNKKIWRLVEGVDDNVTDYISAVGNRVVYHTVTMPEEIQGATISGAATQVVRGMPFSFKVTAVTYSDVVAVWVNGKLMGSDKNIVDVKIPAVTEDLDITVQVSPKNAESYLVINVKEGELASKIANNCPARLKVAGTISYSEFDAFRSHATVIKALDLADLKIKGAGDHADAIPTNAFAPTTMAMSALQSIVLPTQLRSIDSNAFYRCMNITELTIPASVGYIGEGAFTHCTKLGKIVMQGAIPPRIGYSTPFPSHAADITLEVPDGAVPNYEAAEYWNSLKLATSKIYYNIQIDPTRVFNYNQYFELTQIERPATETSVTLGLPNCTLSRNEIRRPGIAFKLFDNGTDCTTKASNLKYGQYSVVFDTYYTNPSNLKCPQNHKIDIVFYYRINVNAPENAPFEFVELDEQDVWRGVDMSVYDSASSEKPTLFKEGEDYRFTVTPKSAGMTPKVTVLSHVMTKFGANPEYADTKTVAVADENGVYTVSNLQGDVTIDVTLVPSDGAVLTPSEIATVDPEDAADITTMGVTGELTEEDCAAIRENFTSVETLDLSGVENSEIPANAFENMESLSSVVIPDNVTAIGDNAFAGCSNLESVTLNSVDAIGENAFAGCDNLTSITINTQGGSAAGRRAVRANGITDASFAGINPNCLIFISDLNFALTDVHNVVYNGSGTRQALTDINLSSAYPFHAPGSFNLGDYTISLEMPLKYRDGNVSNNWTGAIFPFSPSYIEIDGMEHSVASQGANTISVFGFYSEKDETMSIQDEIKPNTPYMVRVNGDGDAEVKAVFSATGSSSAVAGDEEQSTEMYDVQLTPEATEICNAGKDFTLFGDYESRMVTEGDYLLDDTGEVFRLVDMTAGEIPAMSHFNVFIRANEAGAADTFKIENNNLSGINVVEGVNADGLAISREGSLMVIVASEARALAIYDINGRLAASLSLEAGRNTVELPAGIYVVAGVKVMM